MTAVAGSLEKDDGAESECCWSGSRMGQDIYHARASSALKPLPDHKSRVEDKK